MKWPRIKWRWPTRREVKFTIVYLGFWAWLWSWEHPIPIGPTEWLPISPKG